MIILFLSTQTRLCEPFIILLALRFIIKILVNGIRLIIIDVLNCLLACLTHRELSILAVGFTCLNLSTCQHLTIHVLQCPFSFHPISKCHKSISFASFSSWIIDQFSFYDILVNGSEKFKELMICDAGVKSSNVNRELTSVIRRVKLRYLLFLAYLVERILSRPI